MPKKASSDSLDWPDEALKQKAYCSLSISLSEVLNLCLSLFKLLCAIHGAMELPLKIGQGIPKAESISVG